MTDVSVNCASLCPAQLAAAPAAAPISVQQHVSIPMEKAKPTAHSSAHPCQGSSRRTSPAVAVSPAPIYAAAAPVVGAVGGAFAGNLIEKSVRESKRCDVLVRVEDGSTQTFSRESVPAWQSGDRVRLQNGLLTMGGGRP